MYMCGKCGTLCGALWLIFGVLFLIENVTTWDFWGVQWYAIVFILLGLACIGKNSCGACNMSCDMSDSKKKRK